MHSKRKSIIVIQNKAKQKADKHKQRNILKQKANKTKTKKQEPEIEMRNRD